MQQQLDFRAPVKVQPAKPKRTPRQRGDEMAQLATERAERDSAGFTFLARDFVIRYLTAHGASPGEEIVAAGPANGVHCADARAWGSVFCSLSRRGQIVCIRSDLPRQRGHGTSGGKLWGLA